eukprot:1158921-Pelagomonas_calceolata.AAC.12
MHKRKAARKAEEGFRRMDEEDPYAAARRGQLPLTRELQVRLSSGQERLAGPDAGAAGRLAGPDAGAAGVSVLWVRGPCTQDW